MSATNPNRTFSPKAGDLTHSWWVVDAEGLVLGRLAGEVARYLQGKHKATYVPHLDGGDFVVVINVEKTVLSGQKAEQKVFHRHSGYPGGLKTNPYLKNPVASFRRTIKGMLPKTRLGNQMIKKLKIYEGPDHPHTAQNPQPLEVKLAKRQLTKRQ